MVFSSMVFIFLFLPVTCILYFCMPGRKSRNLVLLCCSILFYAWGEPVYLLLMAASILVNWAISQAGPGKKLMLAAAVLFNVSFLFFFKYAGFAVEIVNTLAGTGFTVPQLALPIGISFYTFQALSYVIDVYRGTVPPQKKLVNLALYISLFPQLIAGPIVRYTDIAAQIEDRQETLDTFCSGLALFMTGLAAKVILANNLATVADGIFAGMTAGSECVPAVWGWVAVLSYTFQIYFDFSGYSTMAIGLGRMFGFTFVPNFNYPYTAVTITDFWRRWHLSLSKWFRDYVYIPLGGNRCSVPRHILNILTVWMLTGLWHGAAVNFILWGLYYGILLLVEKYLLSSVIRKLPTFITAAATFFLVSMGWVLFRTDDFHHLLPVFTTLFSTGTTRCTVASYALSHADMISKSVFLLPAILFSFPVVPAIQTALSGKKWAPSARYALSLLLFILCICLLEASTYNPFIYFRF